MGRRYGRNQKRRHRARIAELETEVAYYRQRSLTFQERWSETDKRYRSLASTIVDVLGEHSALLPPREVQGFRPSQPVELPCEVQELRHPQHLHALKLFVENNPRGDLAHVRLRGQDTNGRVGWDYCLSKEALKHYHRLPAVQQTVAEELHHALATYFLGKGR